MHRIRFLLLALFLTIMSYGCATTISKPEKLVDEKVVINSCSKIVEGASSYQHEKIRLTWLLTTEKTLDPISIEELMSICGGSKPCPRMIPMTRTKFEQYAQ
ncbi:MAG: hypothetical protein NT091_02685, partial [Candidatus Falkowbacteria bacterium]|nr:hypothetical protein [Candidatus Falkowbacteria bacterium]